MVVADTIVRYFGWACYLASVCYIRKKITKLMSMMA